MLKMIKEFFLVKKSVSIDQKKNYYDLKLYLEDGTLFLKEDFVNVVHWDNTIYILYDKDGKYKMKIDKGNNTLLVLDNKIRK